jgi:hypothetical protein
MLWNSKLIGEISVFDLHFANKLEEIDWKAFVS